MSWNCDHCGNIRHGSGTRLCEECATALLHVRSEPLLERPLNGIYRKFQHLDRVLRECEASEDPIRRAAAEMWIAIAKANDKVDFSGRSETSER